MAIVKECCRFVAELSEHVARASTSGQGQESFHCLAQAAFQLALFQVLTIWIQQSIQPLGERLCRLFQGGLEETNA